MTYEAVVIELLGNAGDPVEYTFPASGTCVKGDLMFHETTTTQEVKHLTPVGSAYFAGIASVDHTSGTNATTKLACWTHGVFDLTTGSNCTTTLGVPVSMSGQLNCVGVATVTSILDKAKIVGTALETTAAGNAGAVLVQKG